MIISSLAITRQTDDGSDALIYIREFKSNQDEENDDIDIDLLKLTQINDEEESYDDPANATNTKSNLPKSKACSIRHQFLLHSALEKMNQDVKFENKLRVSFNRQINGTDYMWIGLVCIMDEYQFYAYITNTNMKIIVSVVDDIFPEEDEAQEYRDGEIKRILVSGNNLAINRFCTVIFEMTSF